MLSTSRCEIPDVYASALCMRCFVETKTKRNVKLKRENSKECQIECRIPSQVEGQNICQIDCQIESQNIRQIECQNIFKICPNICPDISWHVMVGITRRKVFFFLQTPSNCEMILARRDRQTNSRIDLSRTMTASYSLLIRNLIRIMKVQLIEFLGLPVHHNYNISCIKTYLKYKLNQVPESQCQFMTAMTSTATLAAQIWSSVSVREIERW